LITPEVSTMIAFEVRLNGQRLCTAGHADISVLSALINYLSRPQDLLLTVRASTKGTQSPSQNLTWLDHSRLSVGDEISIKLVDVPTCDAPKDVRTI
jgi:hypothetical protein